MSTTDGHWFGYPPVKGALMAWGARTIFQPRQEKRPLDILWDRQGIKRGKFGTSAYDVFIKHLNTVVLPELQKLAGAYSPDSDDVFVKHFDWSHDENLVIVAQGSPNRSFGYFYISCSLVERSKAPAERTS